jgi:transposase
MERRNHLDDGQRWRAIGRMEAGQSHSEVARFMNVSESVISRLWRQFQETGTCHRRTSQGRPRVTTSQDDRYLALTARRHRRMTGRQLALELSVASGRRVSRQTVYRRLNERGMYARRPMVCVPLNTVQRRARLSWSREHLNWTQEQWSHVLFTDESRFSLQTDSCRIFIWRERGTRNHPSNIIERESFGGGGLMVWGGITLNGRTDLHVIDYGTLTGQRYRDNILDTYVRLFRGAMGPNFILMDDNARPHRAGIVDDYLGSEDIQRMEWPSRSPDLNPIEHAWDALGRHIANRQPPPRTLSELRTALIEEWESLPTELLNSLINSMNHRCSACIAVRGNHTYY